MSSILESQQQAAEQEWLDYLLEGKPSHLPQL